jgi:peptidoglycan/LPS O-acetylase OafA/YrhL
MNLKQEITDLTICRALFAAWVFIYHVDLYLNLSAWLGPFSGLIRRGYIGVDGFFILSGLILARVHPELGQSPATIWTFWGKRLARIYPVHLATIVLMAVLLLMGMAEGLTPRDPGRFGIASLIQNLLLVHGWGFASQGDWNYPSWSVSCEWAGYLLFPSLSFVVAYFATIVALQFVIVGFTIIGLIVVRNHYSINLNFSDGLFRFFPEFIIGIATARIVPWLADTSPSRIFAIAGGVITLVCACLGFNLVTVLGLWLVLFSFTMQADAERPPLFGMRPLLRRFGLLSYAFYMSFAVAELLISQWFRHQGWSAPSHAFFFFFGMLGLTSMIALVLHLVVEIPCRRVIDRRLDARGELSLILK